MIPVRIEDVDRGALDALIDNAVPEGKTIEYKQALPGNGTCQSTSRQPLTQSRP